jgi:hypothetical protein
VIQLINRAKQYKDTLLFKVVKNITQFAPSALETMENQIEDYVAMSMQCEDNTDL